MQEGALGLLKGIERFDINKGNTFATYVVFWIRQAMQRYICKQGDIIRKPVHRYAEFAKIRKTATELTQKLGRTPTPSEIADELQ